LYHVESSFQSTGITSSKAMQILQTAAEGARIGGANLIDVTNALDAAVVSGIPGVQNMGEAMGGLLRIVGSGDMTMQDFADAASTGILAVAKVYGASLTDVGAALATYGDNNIRGAKARTYRRPSRLRRVLVRTGWMVVRSRRAPISPAWRSRAVRRMGPPAGLHGGPHRRPARRRLVPTLRR
jgi:hypothetical protein